MNNEEMITISKAEYEDLIKDQFMLRCLERGGVDNWDWYSESLQPYWDKYENEDL